MEPTQSDIKPGDTVVIQHTSHHAYSTHNWFSGVVARTGHKPDGAEHFLIELRYRNKYKGWKWWCRYNTEWFSSSQLVGKSGLPSEIEQLERMMR